MLRRCLPILLAGGLLGSMVGLPAAAAPPDLPIALTFNHDCFAPALVVAGDGDCDGQFQTYVSESLPRPGNITARGVRFTFPSSATGAKNSLVAAKQTVKLPGRSGYSYLHALVFGTNAPGSTAGGAVTVNYKTGPRGSGSITGHDWYQQPSRAVLKAQGQGPGNPGSMSPLGPANVYVFLATVKLDPRRAAVSITLPSGALPSTNSSPRALHIVAMSLTTRAAPAPRGAVFR